MATVTLRPNATKYSDAIVVTGAATAHAALSDASDASYVEPNLGGVLHVEMATTSLPAGAVTKQVTVSGRGKAAIDANIPAKAELVLAKADGTAIASATSSALSTSIATFAGAAAAVSLSQVDVDGLWVEVRLNSGINVAAPWKSRVHDLWIDLVYAARPTATAIAPTGTITTTTRPTASWSHLPGDDGGMQVAYQLRTFSVAQYGIAGFSPDTSPSTLDSGIVYSTATQVLLDTLANGTSYRTYVRTAQTVNGALHWSDWAYSAYSISVSAPSVATVTAAAIDATARMRIQVARSTGGVDWSSIEIERTDDAGATWVPVRGFTGATTYGDTFVGYDMEAPIGVPVTYRARGTRVASGSPITGAWTSSSPATWSSTSSWLKSLRTPSLSRQVRFTVLPSPARERTVGVFEVLGRPDYVVVTDARRTTRGQIRITTTTEAEADALLALAEETVLLLQSPAGHRFGSRYVALGDLTEVRPFRAAQAATREWVAPYWEVAAPADTGVDGDGLTWSDVVAGYSTWTTLMAARATWTSLL